MNTTGKRHSVDMPLDEQIHSSPPVWFIKHLRILLGSLYNPSVLGKSPLLEWLNISLQPNPAAILRSFLIEAIDLLKPNGITPRGTKTSRIYEILRQRYIEQQIQRKVADNIGLSTRQLQREEHLAIDILGATIWRTNNLQDRARPALDPESTSRDLMAMELSPKQQHDLEWLKTTTPSQSTNIYAEIRDILTTLKRVMKTSKIKVSFPIAKQDSQETPCLQAPILRQGLLNILSFCISQVPGGRICISVVCQQSQIQIKIEAYSNPSRTIRLGTPESESLNLAAEFIGLCGGTLLTKPGKLQPKLSEPSSADFIAELILPIIEPITVLFIEDNADTLELYRRYLINSRYRFVGVRDAREGFTLAQKISPQVIVLDVMMPEKDGWSFLGQATVHPIMQNIPVVICSILQQANLARILGAADFLHKPVSRATLLTCLDRQTERSETKLH